MCALAVIVGHGNAMHRHNGLNQREPGGGNKGRGSSIYRKGHLNI